MKLKQTDLIYKGKTHVLSGFGKVEKPDGRKKITVSTQIAAPRYFSLVLKV